MSQQEATAYMQARSEARELMQGAEPVKTFAIGKMRVTLSKARSVEVDPELPEPFPKMALKPGEDFDSWLK